MSALLVRAVLVFVPAAGAQADEATCKQVLADYRAAPSVARLEPLFPCIDASAPPLRAEIFDKIVCREIWSDPKFNRDVVRRLRAAGKPHDRGSAVFDPVKDTLENLNVNKFVSGMDMWLHNWEREVDPQVLAQRRREQDAHQRRMAGYDRSIKFNLVQLALMLFFYLAFIAKSIWYSRRQRELKRQAEQPKGPPGVKIL